MNATERLADYMRRNARKGMGVTQNTRSVAIHLGMSESQVIQAKENLRGTGRLVMGEQRIESIDGVKFQSDAPLPSPAEPLMNFLRRQFKPVCDARVVDHPEKAFRTKPTEIIVGDVRTSMGFAAAMVLCRSMGCAGAVS